MDEPWEGRLQARRLKGRVQAVGTAQEQAGHELRDHGQGIEVRTILHADTLDRRPIERLRDETYNFCATQVLLPTGHLGQGWRAASCLSVRGRAQDRRNCWGGLHWHLEVLWASHLLLSDPDDPHPSKVQVQPSSMSIHQEEKPYFARPASQRTQRLFSRHCISHS